MNEKYAIIWFEGQDNYTLVDRSGALVLLTGSDARKSNSIVGVLDTQGDVEEALEDSKYAISLSLMEDLFGWDVRA